jgi:hypothetical protein
MDGRNNRPFNVPKRLTTTLLVTIVLAAIFLATGPMPAYAQEFTFQGRVYEGKVGDESRPIQGVTVTLYGATDPYPAEGELIARTTTDGKGWYGLEVPLGFEYYSIRETNPKNYESVGATTVDGQVRTADWIEYVILLEEQTLTGNKFWDIRVLEQPPTTPVGPDLAILSVNNWEFDTNTGTLTLFVEVANEGNLESSDTAVYVQDFEHEWLHKYGLVPTIDPEKAIPIELRLEIPEELRGSERMFSVVLDPENEVRETNEENNEAMTPMISLPLPEDRVDEEDNGARTSVLPLPPPEQRPEEELPEDELPLLALVTVATVIVVGTIVIIRRTIQIRRRKEWQEKAEEEEPPESCQPCNRYCQKKIKLDLAQFRMASLTLVAHDPVSNEKIKERIVKGEIVADFNEVITARRRRAKPEKLLNYLEPFSHALLQTIVAWLRDESAPRDVSIVGHLEGSKVECQFILYHCERKGDLNDWTVEAKWKATIKHERDEPVGTLHSLDPLETEISERQTPVLIRLLMQFVEQF